MDFKLDFQNWDNGIRIVYLILPGIVFFETLKRFNERPYPAKEVYIAKIIYASMFIFVLNNAALYFWSLILGRWRISIPDPLQVPIQAILVPIMLALLVAFADQKRWFNRLVARLGIDAVDPSPSGWDYLFSQRRSMFVIIGLKDGSRVGGYFGPDSMASSNPSDKDIYVEKVYVIPDDAEHPWSEIERSQGMLIPYDQIQYLEFRA